MSAPRLVRFALAAALVLLAAGCGGEDMKLSEAASTQLEQHIAAIRAAAWAGDRAGAEEAVAQLRGTVTGLSASGEISEARAEDVLAAAAKVEAQLGLLPPPPAAPAVDVAEDDERDDDEDERKDGDGGRKGKDEGKPKGGG